MNRKILCIDDNRSILRFYFTVLADCDVVVAETGEAGYSFAREAYGKRAPFAVAFVDIMLPGGIDGLTTAQKIRKSDPCIEFVIVTSGDTTLKDVADVVLPPEKLIFLRKPFNVEEIRQIATCLTRKWNAERELRRTNRNLKRAIKIASDGLRRSAEIWKEK